MSRKPVRVQYDEEFIRAANDEVRECELGYSVTVTSLLRPGYAKHVVELVMHAVGNENTPWAGQAITVRAMWPNSRAQTLPAFLYQTSITLRRAVDTELRLKGLVA